MAEQDRKIVETVKKTLPNLTDLQKERLLAFAEGAALIAEQQIAAQNGARPA